MSGCVACCSSHIVLLVRASNGGSFCCRQIVERHSPERSARPERACLNFKLHFLTAVLTGSVKRCCTENMSVLSCRQRCIWHVQGTGQCCTSDGTSGPGDYAHNWADGLVSNATVLAAGEPPMSWRLLMTSCLSTEELLAKAVHCCHEAAS